MTSSAQLERENEAIRAELADTLAELRARITPGQVMDQVLDYARDSGAGAFTRNLGRDIVGNPLPAGLVGLGVAWLMMSNARRSRSAGRSGGDGRWHAANARVDGATGEVGAGLDSVRDSARHAAETAAAMGAQARDTAASAYEGAADTYRSATERLGSAADRAADTAASLGRNAAARGGDLLQFCRSQPLVLAGIGLVIGAALGAALPATRTEQELMGEASDEVKERARTVAEEQFENAKDVAQDQYERAKTGVQQGLREALEELNREAERAAGSDAPGPDRGREATLVPGHDPDTPGLFDEQESKKKSETHGHQ